MKKLESAVSISSQSTDQVIKPDVTTYLSSVSLNNATKKILDYSRSITSGFIGIGYELSNLQKNPHVLTDCGYPDVYSYGEKVFGFKSTSVKNFISVFDRYSLKGNSYPALASKYKDYSFTQLVELLPVDDVSNYKPEMTVVEIRDKKILDKVSAEKTGLLDYLTNGIKDMLSSFEKVKVGKSNPTSWSNDDYSFDFSFVYEKMKVSGVIDYSFKNGLTFADLSIGNRGYYDYGTYHSDFVSLKKYLSSKLKEALSDKADVVAQKASNKKDVDEVAHPLYIEEIREYRSAPDSSRLSWITGDNLISDNCLFFFDGFNHYCEDDNFFDITNHSVGEGFPLLIFVSVTPYNPKGSDKVVDTLYIPYKGGHFSAPVDAATALKLIDKWCDDEILIDDSLVAGFKKKAGDANV